MLLCATSSSISIVFLPGSSLKRAVSYQLIPQWLHLRYFVAPWHVALSTTWIVICFCSSTITFCLAAVISCSVAVDVLSLVMLVALYLRLRSLRQMVVLLRYNNGEPDQKKVKKSPLQKRMEELWSYMKERIYNKTRKMLPAVLYVMHFIVPTLFFWIRGVQGLWPFIGPLL